MVFVINTTTPTRILTSALIVGSTLATLLGVSPYLFVDTARAITVGHVQLRNDRDADQGAYLQIDASNGEGLWINSVQPQRFRSVPLLKFNFKAKPAWTDTAVALEHGCGRTPSEAVDRIERATRLRTPVNPGVRAVTSVFCSRWASQGSTRPGTWLVDQVSIAGSNEADLVSLNGLPARMQALVELGGGADIFTGTASPEFVDNGINRTSNARFDVCADRFRRVSRWSFGSDGQDCAGPVPRSLNPALPSGDIIYGGNENDQLFGADGSDVARGLGGSDQITLGAGDDGAFGGADNDYITGGAGNDQLDIARQVGTLNGADQSELDRSEASAVIDVGGNDILDGGSGDEDRVGYPWTTRPVRGTSRAVFIDIPSAHGRRQMSVDTFVRIEKYELGQGNDEFLITDPAGNIAVTAGPGDDYVDASRNPSSTARDSVDCGEPRGRTATQDNDQVLIDAPRQRHENDPENQDPTTWLRDSTHSCERVITYGGFVESDFPSAP